MSDRSSITQLPCANTERLVNGNRSPCLEPALMVCKGCYLVQYCSRECHLAHWGLHKGDCKSPLMKTTWKPSWDVESRTPAWKKEDGPSMDLYGGEHDFWGDMPALDIVNPLQNEVENPPKDFRLLFAASGDIRNVVKSLYRLPESHTSECEILINDNDFDVLARNLILLLTALHFSPEEATPIMLHIWYSALIPEQILHSLQQNILPLIQDVCLNNQGKPATDLQSKVWTYGSRTLYLMLEVEKWDRLPSYFQVPDGLSMAQAQNIMTSITLAQERRDYVDWALYKLPPPWRVCMMKFRRDGILLPFGSSRSEFNTPNPTFYQTKDTWPMQDLADPLQGWSIKEVMQKAPFAKNDIYGSLYLFIQDVLLEFCSRLEKFDHIGLFLLQVDVLSLPTVLSPHKHYFDRIEDVDKLQASNLGDRSYLGLPTTLDTFAPLLKRKTQNPHATLLVMFPNAVDEVFWVPDNIPTPTEMLNAMSNKARVSHYLPVTQAMMEYRDGYAYKAGSLLFHDAEFFFRNFDDLFRRYVRQYHFEEEANAVGLEMKSTNTIIEPWPMRLKENATQPEFDALLGSNRNGSERYVEWRSAT